MVNISLEIPRKPRVKKTSEKPERKVQAIKVDHPLPLPLKAVAAEKYEFQQALDALLAAGASVQYEEQTRTPQHLRKRFGDIAADNADLRRSVATALVEGKHVVSARERDVEEVQRELQKFMEVTTDSEDPRVKAAVEAVNNNAAFQEERRRYVTERLVRDVPAAESKTIKWTVGVALGAAVASSGFNMAGNESAGLAFAGQTDDGANLVLGIFTKNTENKLKKLAQGIPSIAAAVAADIYLLPLIFAAANPAVAIGIGAVAYFLTAVAGSLTAEVLDFRENMKTIARLDKEGLLPGREKLHNEHLRELRYNDKKDEKKNKEFQDSLRKAKPEEVRDKVLWALDARHVSPEEQAEVMQEVDTILAKSGGDKLLKESLLRLRWGERAKLAWSETISNPFRKWLGIGIAASGVASVAAGVAGLLPAKGILTAALNTVPTVKHFLEGMTEAVVGPIETFIGLGGSQVLDAKLYDRKRNRELRKRIKQAKPQ